MTQLELPLFDVEMTESQLMRLVGVWQIYKTVNYDQFYAVYWRRICSLMKSRNWTAVIVDICGVKYKYTLNPKNITGISRNRMK